MPEILHSAAYRIALVYSTVLAIVVILVGTAFYFSFNAALLDQLVDRITNESLELRSEFTREGLPGLLNEVREREGLPISGGLGYALFSIEGNKLAGRMSTKISTPGTHKIHFNDPLEGPDSAWAEVSVLDNGMTLIVAADLEPLEQVDATIFLYLLVALTGILLLGLGGGLVLGNYLRLRLGAINSAAHAIMAGDLSQRMTLSENNDEFDHLSATLNAMLDRINLLMENLRQVSGDIAHDLRTPLSRLHNRLQHALSSRTALPEFRVAIEEALIQTNEVMDLFSAILRISEIESGKIASSFRNVNISVLVEELCQSYAPALEDRGRSLVWDISPDLNMQGDRELIAQAVINLLENAQKHTPYGTLVQVFLSATEGTITLGLGDNGPGVSENDRSRISARFVRLEQARTTPGNGLGLNLVEAIAALHKARLEFSDNNPGLLVTLRFISSQ